MSATTPETATVEIATVEEARVIVAQLKEQVDAALATVASLEPRLRRAELAAEEGQLHA